MTTESTGITAAASRGWAALRISIAKRRGINVIKSTAGDEERRKGYLTFLPAMLVHQLQVQATKRDCSGGEVHPETIYQHGVVFFADLSGFTKLTEKLAVHAHGAELLCSELDKVTADKKETYHQLFLINFKYRSLLLGIYPHFV